MVHAVGNYSQSINIQTGIGFVQNREPRFQHGHLQNLVSLLLTAGKTFVDRTSHKTRFHLHDCAAFSLKVFEFEGIEFLYTEMLLLFVISESKKLGIRNARNFNRI